MAKPKHPPEQNATASEGEPDLTSRKAFDLWLRRGLHDLFDAVANEPIPRKLLQLLGKDDDTPRDGPAPD